jgi:uncharacterized Zn-finger protein
MYSYVNLKLLMHISLVFIQNMQPTIDSAQTKIMIRMQTCKHDPHPHPFCDVVIKETLKGFVHCPYLCYNCFLKI